MKEQEFIDKYKKELSELKERFPNLSHSVEARPDEGENAMAIVSIEPYDEDSYMIFEMVSLKTKKHKEAIQDHIKAIEKHYKE